MGIKVEMTDRGLIQTKSSTASAKSVDGFSPGRLPVTTLSASSGTRLSAETPGMYYVNNVSTCSIGLASNLPGAEYIFTAITGSNAFRCNITGTAVSGIVVFCAPFLSGAVGVWGTPFLSSGSLSSGACLKLAADGSAILKSDGRRWMIMGGTGSMDILATGL